MATEVNVKNFEKKLEELKSIVNKLDGGEISLEEALKIYEKGVSTSKELEEIIKFAKEKANEIAKKQ